jgi:hypothetical protein
VGGVTFVRTRHLRVDDTALGAVAVAASRVASVEAARA